MLVLLPLLMQTTGMAALIQWIRIRHTKGMYPLGVLGSCVLMMRFTVAIFALHLLEILPWAAGGVVASPAAPRSSSAAFSSIVGGGVLLLGVQLVDGLLYRLFLRLEPIL
jgi:hypothetical protein